MYLRTLVTVKAKVAPDVNGHLVMCVIGSYIAYLISSILQERLVTYPYLHQPLHNSSDAQPTPVLFRVPVFLNTVQTFFNCLTGAVYLMVQFANSNSGLRTNAPTKAIILPMFIVSIICMFASKLSNAAISHVDYTALIVARACLLLPTMFLNITLLRKRFPLSKYLLVLTLTVGVILFTLYDPRARAEVNKPLEVKRKPVYGLALLAANLIVDGFTYVIQEYVYSRPQRYGKFNSGMEVTVAQNGVCTIFTGGYLLATNILAATGNEKRSELEFALSYLQQRPVVLVDIFIFAAGSAISQLLIFIAFDGFSSLLQVNIRVTKKMLSIFCSILWFEKSLVRLQWVGAVLVFFGLGVEGWLQRKEQQQKLEEHSKVE